MRAFEYSGLPHGRIDHERALQMYKDGASDAEIAVGCGVRRESAAVWRRKNGLPAHKKYPKRHKTGIEWLHRVAEINAKARANGMTYGKYTAPAVIVRGRRK